MLRSLMVAAVLIGLTSWLRFTSWGLGAEEVPRPNVVFVLVDDLRWDDLSCAGNPFTKTPHIDRVGQEGARFLNAFATTPLCSPSRASILTSQYAQTHGITDNTERGPQSHRLRTFPQELQKLGYKTAYIGKWHMGNDFSRRPGFDRWYCLKGQGSTFDSIVNDEEVEVQTRGYVTDVLNEQAVAFVRQTHSQPFLLYLSHKAVHPETVQHADGSLSDPTLSNFIPAPRHKELYAGVAIPRRPNWGVPPRHKPALQQTIAGVPPLGPETGSSDTAILNRLRMLASIDEGVGELLNALEETGQLNNTVFVVASDHGYFYGEHGLSVERRLAYEESIRIPLLVRYPRLIEAGSTPESLAITLDLAPTFVELAGGQAPTQYQGRSLVPLLKGNVPADWRNSFLVEYFSDTVFPRMHKMAYQAVRNDRWKYIRYLEHANADELYDLQSDPYELNNLAVDSASASSLVKLQAELEGVLAEINPAPLAFGEGTPAAVANQATTLDWHSVTPSVVEGQGWTDTEEPFDRFPARAKSLVRKPVWNLSKHSAGLYVDFLTDARNISANWTLNSSRKEMAHMPATGVSGLDLYIQHDDGKWYFLGNGRPTQPITNEGFLIRGLVGQQARYRLYFPLYNGVTDVKIGVPQGATFQFTKATDPPRKPVVIYGTSITQGGCASRPGMSFPAILGRRLHVPIVNLGFSGNGKAEAEVAQLLAELEPAAFLLDPLGNLQPNEVAERMPDFVRILRERHPEVPILLNENVRYPTTRFIESRKERVNQSNQFLQAIHKKRVGFGDRNIFIIPSCDLTSDSNDTTVDGTHPTDLGFLRMADAIEPYLRKVLQ